MRSMKKIKVKPAVSSFVRKFSHEKKQPESNTSPPPVYTVPNDTQLQVGYQTGLEMTSLPEKPPLEESSDSPTSSPILPDTSVKNLWHSFRSNTTMHGLKYASEIHKYKLRGVIWAIALICMGGMLIYTCVDLYHKYTLHPTISDIKVELVNKLPFPAITFCNLSPFKKSALKPDQAMEHYLLSLSRMGEFSPPLDYDNPFYSQLSQPLPDGWIYNVSFTHEDMFPACVSMQDDVMDCKVVLTPKLTDIGLCYTYNSREYIKEHQPLVTSTTGSAKSLAIYVHVDQDEYVFNDNLAAGMKIIVHDPDEEPDTNKGFFASPGFSSYASLHLSKHKYLPSPYKSAGGHYCLDTKAAGFKNPLVHHDAYSRTACTKECTYHYVVSKCGCQAPTDIGNAEICSMRKYAECYNPYRAYYMRNRTIQQACECNIPCEFNVYRASVTTAYFPSKLNEHFMNTYLGLQKLRTDYMELRIFFDTLSFLKVEYLAEYDMEKIVATLGGQMGIFLGASLLTLSELLEFLLMAVLVVCKRIALRRQN